jgi:hypothetical protein
MFHGILCELALSSGSRAAFDNYPALMGKITTDRQHLPRPQVAEDLRLQRLEWSAQRAGWAVLGVFVGLSLLGLFGQGPLSRTSAGEGGSLVLHYERFWRQMSPMSITVRLAPEATREGEARLLLNQAYLEKVVVEHVMPEPKSVEAAPAGTVFAFKIAQPGREAAITFVVEPRKFGCLEGAIELEKQTSVVFRQIIYP